MRKEQDNIKRLYTHRILLPALAVVCAVLCCVTFLSCAGSRPQTVLAVADAIDSPQPEPASGLEAMRSCELDDVSGFATLNFFSHEVNEEYRHFCDYRRNKKYDKAFECLDAIVRECPKDGLPFYLRASCLREQEEYRKAVVCMSDFIESNPDDPIAYYMRARCRVKFNKYSYIISDLEKAIELNPMFSFAYNDMAWILATWPDKSRRNGEKALEYAQKSSQMLTDSEENPGDNIYGAYQFLMNIDKEENKKISRAGILDTLAAAYAELQEYEKAAELQKEATAKLKASKLRKKYGYKKYRKIMKGCRERLECYQSRQPWQPEVCFQEWNEE